MKHLIPFLILSVFLFTASCSQNDIKKEGKAGKTESKPTVVKTVAHIQIPNSNLYIIPPAGFIENEVAGQLQKDTPDGIIHSFMVMKIISGYTWKKYFAELKADSEKNFPGFWKEEQLNVNGHIATLYQYKNFGLTQHYLYFPDGYSDEMIVANYDENDTATANEMYRVLKTVFVEK